jgi:hypothetical protein
MTKEAAMTKESPLKASEPSSWKPYLIGFGIGAVILTLMPLLQARFLKAPPPVMQLDTWSTTSLAGGDVGSKVLSDKVTMLSLELGPCDADCAARVKDFGAMVSHVNDLRGRVVLVSMINPDDAAVLNEAIKGASPMWRFAEGDPRLMTQLQKALVTFLGADKTDLARSHAIVIIDQNNAVRGFWQPDIAGRGNAVNAARLLAKRGPSP